MHGLLKGKNAAQDLWRKTSRSVLPVILAKYNHWFPSNSLVTPWTWPQPKNRNTPTYTNRCFFSANTSTKFHQKNGPRIQLMNSLVDLRGFRSRLFTTSGHDLGLIGRPIQDGLGLSSPKHCFFFKGQPFWKANKQLDISTGEGFEGFS